VAVVTNGDSDTVHPRSERRKRSILLPEKMSMKNVRKNIVIFHNSKKNNPLVALSF
jgi:hypothetical protein